jgi:hypothetical protein
MTAVAMEENERDRLAHARTADFTWFAVGFLIGFGAFVVRTNQLLPPAADKILMVMEFSAVAIWGWAYARMAIHARRVRSQPALRTALNDERYKSVRLLAARAAFKAIIAANTLMLLAGLLFEPFRRLPATLPVEVTIWVAIGAMAVAQTIYDRE